jgi:hypothetical protein
MSNRGRIMLGALLTCLFFVAPKEPATADCGATGSLLYVSSQCTYLGSQLQSAISAQSEYSYRVQPRCATASGPACFSPRQCANPPGSWSFWVLRSHGGPWQLVGMACLTNSEAAEFAHITPDLVATAFRRLTWPSPTLKIQPPGGETLVNLATNFYTIPQGVQIKRVTLLGQQVEIEATETSWRWWFGDGLSKTTQTPGRPYPELTITHHYQTATTNLTPQVAVTYTGRFRVNNSSWRTIPTPLTVTGPATTLRVLEAAPRLVN